MKRHILFFEIEDFIANLVLPTLKEKYDIVRIDSPINVISILQHTYQKYDLIMLNVSIPANLFKSELNDFSLNEKAMLLLDNGDNAGVVIAEKIRSLPGFENFPIIFYTSKYMKYVQTTLSNTRYILKPSFPSVIINTIEDIFDKTTGKHKAKNTKHVNKKLKKNKHNEKQ